MNVVVALEHRFDRTPDGAIWTRTMFAHGFWQRYLEVFDGVRVVARVRDVESPAEGWVRADGDKIQFVAVPHFIGPFQYSLRSWSVRKAVQSAVDPAAAILLRAPSQLASVMMGQIARTRHPYGVEVVGDPYDVFAPGAIKHPLRPLFRRHFSRLLCIQTKNAVAATYVTQFALQQRYPAGKGAYSTFYSDVELDDSAYVEEPRVISGSQRAFRLITISTLAQSYKRVDILIDAIGLLVADGWDVELHIIGDGRHRAELEERARRLSLADRVIFRGQITAGVPVRMELDKADLFILASRQEGLPRAMIEAMARAVPCIGTCVGGTPELLAPDHMVVPDRPYELAMIIERVLSSPDLLTAMSARNLEKSREYRDDALRCRRVAFYAALRERTEQWLEMKTGRSSCM